MEEARNGRTHRKCMEAVAAKIENGLALGVGGAKNAGDQRNGSEQLPEDAAAQRRFQNAEAQARAVCSGLLGHDR